MDPDAMRRRGMRKIAIGVALLVLAIVITIMIMPSYYR